MSTITLMPLCVLVWFLVLWFNFGSTIGFTAPFLIFVFVTCITGITAGALCQPQCLPGYTPYGTTSFVCPPNGGDIGISSFTCSKGISNFLASVYFLHYILGNYRLVCVQYGSQ